MRTHQEATSRSSSHQPALALALPPAMRQRRQRCYLWLAKTAGMFGYCCFVLSCSCYTQEPKYRTAAHEPKWLSSYISAAGSCAQTAAPPVAGAAVTESWWLVPRRKAIVAATCGPTLHTPCCPSAASVRLSWQLHSVQAPVLGNCGSRELEPKCQIPLFSSLYIPAPDRPPKSLSQSA